MILKIPNLLSVDDLKQIQASLAQAEFIDGKLSSGWHARLVKNNEQLRSETATAKALRAKIHQALVEQPLFECAIRPRAIHISILPLPCTE